MKRFITLTFALWMLSVSSSFGQGRSIENIGLGIVVIIEMGNNGDIWVGSQAQGVAFYNGAQQTWTYYNSTTNPGQFKSDSITSLTFGLISGVQHVFIGTKNGLAYQRANVWDTLNVPARMVTGVSLVNSDTLWVATANGLATFDSAKHLIRTYNTGNSSLPFNQSGASQKGGQQCTGFAAGTPNSGAYYTKNYSTFTQLDTSVPHSKLVDNRVTTIFRDNNCTRYLVGTRGGLSFCPEGVPCQNFTTANGLPQDFITSIGLDCHGYIWAGTLDSGLVIYNGSTFSRLTTANGLSDNRVTSISFDMADCSAHVSSVDGNITVIDSNKTVVKVFNAIADVSADRLSVSVYPQPASEQINFVMGTELSSAELTLTDLSGRTVQNLSIHGSSHISADVSALPIGLYLYRLTTDGQTAGTGKVQVLR